MYILTFSQTGLLQRHYCHSISVDLEGDMSLDINLVNKHELLSSIKNKVIGLDKQFFERKIVKKFLPIFY